MTTHSCDLARRLEQSQHFVSNVIDVINTPAASANQSLNTVCEVLLMKRDATDLRRVTVLIAKGGTQECVNHSVFSCTPEKRREWCEFCDNNCSMDKRKRVLVISKKSQSTPLWVITEYKYSCESDDVQCEMLAWISKWYGKNGAFMFRPFGRSLDSTNMAMVPDARYKDVPMSSAIAEEDVCDHGEFCCLESSWVDKKMKVYCNNTDNTECKSVVTFVASDNAKRVYIPMLLFKMYNDVKSVIWSLVEAQHIRMVYVTGVAQSLAYSIDTASNVVRSNRTTSAVAESKQCSHLY